MEFFTSTNPHKTFTRLNAEETATWKTGDAAFQDKVRDAAIHHARQIRETRGKDIRVAVIEGATPADAVLETVGALVRMSTESKRIFAIAPDHVTEISRGTDTQYSHAVVGLYEHPLTYAREWRAIGWTSQPREYLARNIPGAWSPAQVRQEIERATAAGEDARAKWAANYWGLVRAEAVPAFRKRKEAPAKKRARAAATATFEVLAHS